MITNGVSPEKCRYLKIKEHGKLKVYNMVFPSVSEIHSFLKENPVRNNMAFTVYKSETAREEFAGPPLDQAIRSCVAGYEENYDQFLELEKQLESVNKSFENQRKIETGFVGHRPNVPAYIAGAPKTMYRNVGKESGKKIINMFMNVTYEVATTEKQILNRGIIALNLIRLLERNGYIVNFRLFEACMITNEVFLCEVVMKRPGQNVNTRMCYYPMCGKGFVRRILSRIKESMPFQENWGMSYGSVLNESYARIIMGMDKNDIYIGSPLEMDIKGDDLYEDADRMVEKLGIGDKIVIPQYRHMTEKEEVSTVK